MSEQMLSIIVTAAGKGTRFGGTRPKQFEKINKIGTMNASLFQFILYKKLTTQ